MTEFKAKSPAEMRKLAEAAGSRHTPATIARFMSRVAQSDACWEWTGSTSGKPTHRYGNFMVGGVAIKSHRFSYECFVGPLIPNHFICHHCDNPGCVRPDHLYQGTPADNVRDAIARERHSNGQADKEYCPKGHPYAEWNTYHYEGQRQCRVCKNLARGRLPFSGLTPPNPSQIIHDANLLEAQARRIEELERLLLRALDEAIPDALILGLYDDPARYEPAREGVRAWEKDARALLSTPDAS